MAEVPHRRCDFHLHRSLDMVYLDDLGRKG